MPEAPVIRVDGAAITVRVRRSAMARRYRLSVDSARGEIRLSMPLRASLPKALGWVEGHTAWIAAQMAGAPPAIVLADGAIFPLEGRDVRICWMAGTTRRVHLDGDRLLVGGPVEQVGPRVLRWLKTRARATLEAETRALAASAALDLDTVGIGDPRARWGSCSSTGAIRYSWRLILAPDHVRRATVAHEVAHILHMDHSPAFHAFHAELLGEDPRPARRWLRVHGAALHRIG